MDAGEYLRGLFLSRRQHPDATGKSLECVTEGDTVEEALENARDVIRLVLESRAAHGEPIPDEKTPVEIQTAAVDV